MSSVLCVQWKSKLEPYYNMAACYLSVLQVLQRCESAACVFGSVS